MFDPRSSARPPRQIEACHTGDSHPYDSKEANRKNNLFYKPPRVTDTLRRALTESRKECHNQLRAANTKVTAGFPKREKSVQTSIPEPSGVNPRTIQKQSANGTEVLERA